jgi:hypothetical protein
MKLVTIVMVAQKLVPITMQDAIVPMEESAEQGFLN